MESIVLLAKAAGAAHYAHRLKDANVLNEIKTLTHEIPKISNPLVPSDEHVEEELRLLVDWIVSQPVTSDIIESVLNTRVKSISVRYPDESLFELLTDIFSEKKVSNFREIIARNIADIKNKISDLRAKIELRNLTAPVLQDGRKSLPEENWQRISELAERELARKEGVVDSAVIARVDSNNISGMAVLLKALELKDSPEGVLKTPFVGINLSLSPAFGFKRGTFWLVNGLTNGGKSYFMTHLLVGLALYNKPMLTDSSKIPTLFYCSAEDEAPEVMFKLFEIFYSVRTGISPNDVELTAEEKAEEVYNGFNKFGWKLEFFRVNPSMDSISEVKARVRKLQREGHEIIATLYDYIGLMTTKGVRGESNTDRLQCLFRDLRTFFNSQNILTITPHQLNPKAKELFASRGDEELLSFVKDVGGKSMTEGSTKLTNEVDGEITVHIAKLSNGREYFTWFVGKIRGKLADIKERYGAMEIDKKRGLIHDIELPKPLYTRDPLRKKEIFDEILGDDDELDLD